MSKPTGNDRIRNAAPTGVALAGAVTPTDRSAEDFYNDDLDDDDLDDDDLDDDDLDDDDLDDDDLDDDDLDDGDLGDSGGAEPISGATFDDVDDYLDTVISRAPSSRIRHDQEPTGDSEADAARAAGCAPCTHALAHGWWGDIAPARAHCDGCHRSWRSYGEGHCTSCHRQFHNQPAFDAHLTADSCRDPQDIDRQDGRVKFRSTDTAFGPVWRLVNYRRLPDFTTLGE